MISCSDIEENILIFTVLYDKLGDIADEMLRIHPNPFPYEFYPLKGHWTRRPGNRELLKLERMIGDARKFAKATMGYLIDERKRLMSCKQYNSLSV